MVYSKSLEYVFYSIPKCATHSLYSVLCKYFGAVRYGDFHYYGAKPRGAGKYVVMTAIRNPYDRAVSAFYGIEQGKTLQWSNPIFDDLKKKGNIKALFEWAIEKGIDEVPTGWLRPQAHYIEKYMNGVDYYIKTTDITGSIKSLPFYDGRAFKVPVLNKSVHGDWGTVLKTKEIIRLVNKMYERDFEFLGFEKLEV